MSKATREELEVLWHLVLTAAIDRLRTRVSVELLQVARKFLRDNAVTPPDEAARKDLEAMYRLYSQKLHEALSQPLPRAGVLSEARQWLTHHGIRPDLPAAHAAAVAKKLGELDLPFTFTKH